MDELCAVCNKGKGPTKCEICGFSDNGVINREFVVIEDANHWLETVVMPYRMQWESSKIDSELLTRVARLKQKRESNSKYYSCIAAGCEHTVGLRSDGTVVAVGCKGKKSPTMTEGDHGQCNVSVWRDIVAIAASSLRTVGLKLDGTVVAVGRNCFLQRDVNGWRDIVAVATGRAHIVGLKKDGTVLAVGKDDRLNLPNQPLPPDPCDVSDWRNIIAIAAGASSTIGFNASGTVAAAGENSKYFSSWRDIVAIAISNLHVVGLNSDGTVVTLGGRNFWLGNIDCGQCNVEDWNDIVMISTGSFHTVGLKANGTVIAAGDNRDGQCEVTSWCDVVAIAAGDSHTVGLKSDGTVVAVGSNKNGQCNTENWYNIGPVEEEQRILRAQKDILELSRVEQGLCRYCGRPLSRILHKCKTCGKK